MVVIELMSWENHRDPSFEYVLRRSLKENTMLRKVVYLTKWVDLKQLIYVEQCTKDPDWAFARAKYNPGIYQHIYTSSTRNFEISHDRVSPENEEFKNFYNLYRILSERSKGSDCLSHIIMW